MIVHRRRIYYRCAHALYVHNITARLRARMHARPYARKPERVHACTPACLYVRMSSRACACTRVRLSASAIVRVRTCACSCVSVRARVRARMHVCEHASVRSFVSSDLRKYIRVILSLDEPISSRGRQHDVWRGRKRSRSRNSTWRHVALRLRRVRHATDARRFKRQR